MFNRIITWSLEHRLLVIVLALVLMATGIEALFRLPIDAFPDTTPVQVQVNTVAPALSPLEVEQQVTFPVEQVIGGLAGLTEVRSISKAGLSQVTILFKDGTNIFQARQQVMERLQTATLPEGIAQPELGPVATGLGEVFHYLVTGDDKTLEELTTIHEWVIKPRLRSVPGVAEINTWGGEIKQYHVLVDLTRLLGYGLTLGDVAAALRDNNLTVGGGHINQAGERHLVRGLGLITSLEEIARIVIGAHNGTPLRIADIGEVEIGHEIRRGAVTANGKGEVVLGLGFMLMGENSGDVTERLKSRLDEIRPSLPAGISVQPVYDRTELVDQVIATVRENLFEGAILVVAVLFIFLGNFRAGLIVASAIPLSMLFAFNAMLRFGIAGSLMSLGAIDFGLIVDSSVIMIENSVRKLGRDPERRSVLAIVRDASLEVRKPTMYGELMIMIVYLPILTLEGVEGKLFRPMALTVIFALLGSLILSLTLMPVLSSLLLKPGRGQREALAIRAAKRCYLPILRLAMRARVAFLVAAIVLLASGLWLASRTGTEFVPRLSEMGIVINTVRLSGVSLEESVRYGTRMEQLILEKFPDEVRDVWVRTGTAAVATDPMGIELSDVFLTLTPRGNWRRAKTQAQLTEVLREELSALPGMRMVFTQPIEMRVNEMVAGIRADVGVKILGNDLEKLKELSAQVADILTSIPGSVDLYAEQLAGQSMLEIVVDQDAVARYGISARAVLDIVEAIGPKKVGEIREGQQRFDLAIRLDEASRADITSISRLVVPTSQGGAFPWPVSPPSGRRKGRPRLPVNGRSGASSFSAMSASAMLAVSLRKPASA